MNNAFRASADVIVRTHAFAQAEAFYGSVLGLRASSRSDTLLCFDTGAFRLFVEPGPPHGPVFEFLVADVEAAKRRLLDAGCVLVEEDASVPRCYVRDPFGLTFNIGRASAP
jgi:catechol 2,3-dioxygenase-like lactoylglutathione lyase family enzyme